MKRTLIFAKRNTLEMLRDPLIYLFCIAFPVVLIVLFSVINSFTSGAGTMFEPATLIPGIIVFSYTFIMLSVSLLVSKDKSTAFTIRLYTSPMRPVNFVFGYVLPAFIMGIAQLVVCILCGYIASLVCGQTFFSFANVLLLMLSSLPNLIMCVFLGVLIGVVFNDKAASAITSVFISVSGILGGAWIPLDTMGGFETFCRFLPFYPSVYIGRVITGAQHTFGGVYEWNATATIGLITIFIYLAIAVVLSVLLFAKKSTCDNK